MSETTPRPWYSCGYREMTSRCPHCKGEIKYPDGGQLTAWEGEDNLVVADFQGKRGEADAALAAEAINEHARIQTRITVDIDPATGRLCPFNDGYMGMCGLDNTIGCDFTHNQPVEGDCPLRLGYVIVRANPARVGAVSTDTPEAGDSKSE